MMFGREMNLPIYLALGRPVDETSTYSTNYVIDLEETMTIAHEAARENLGTTAKNMKETYDKGLFHKDYQVGDAVWLYSDARKKG